MGRATCSDWVVTMVGVTWAVGALVVCTAIGRMLAVGVVVTVGLTAAVGAVCVGATDGAPSGIDGATTFRRACLSRSACRNDRILISMMHQCSTNIPITYTTQKTLADANS